jgi:hypothetical protein
LQQRRQIQVTLSVDVQEPAPRNLDLWLDGGRGVRREHMRMNDEALQAQVREILDAVPARYKTKRAHYDAILAMNDTRPDEQKWCDRSMNEAAAIDPSDAKRARIRAAPDSPRTSAVREFLAPTTAKTASERYRCALQANDERIEGEKWPDESMQKAAGIDPWIAREIRNRQAPDTPQTNEVREFLATTTAMTAAEKYRHALQANDERIESQKWPDKSMQKAAGIDASNARDIRNRRAPDTPRTVEVGAFLATTNAATSRERYRRALQANDKRIEGQKWPDQSMRKATDISSSEASRVRKELLGIKRTRKRPEPDGA